MRSAEAPVFTPDQQKQYSIPYVVGDTADQSEVQPVQGLESEAEAQADFNQWIGSQGLKTSFEVPMTEKEQAPVNALERLRAAKAGSEEAMKWLTINIDKATFEAVFKEEYIGDTYMNRNADDELVQFGQSNDSIYRNAINLRPNRHHVLQRITLVEALNRHRIEAALKSGQLSNNRHYVVFSLVPNGVPEKELGPEGDGFFLDSLSLNIQATTELASGRVKTETGFMAGVEAGENDSFEDRLASRFDLQAVAKIYEWFGQEPPSTVEDTLDSGLIMDLPNGVADVMRIFAMAKDEVLGRKVERNIEDFLALKLESKRKEASLKQVRQKVLEDLLAKADELKQPMDVVQFIWDRVRKHALKNSFENPNIDPKVFGRAAAPHIVAAHYHIQNGNLQLAQEYMTKAEKVAVITGCGGGSSSTETGEGLTDGFSNSIEGSSGRDKHGSRRFKCPNGHLNVRPHNKLIDKCQHNGCTAVVKC